MKYDYVKKQGNPGLGAAVSAALAIAALSLPAGAWAQQADDPSRSDAASRQGTSTQGSRTPGASTASQSGTGASAEAARELRQAQEQVQDAGEAVSEARGESREAVREGREAGRAAQQAARDGSGNSAMNDSATSDSSERRRTASAESSDSRDSSQRGSASGPDAVWLLVPVAMSKQTEQQSQECWVRLYSGENFEGRYITIAGPAEVPELRSPYGTGLNNWESAVVGPKATVVTFDDDNFDDRSATLRGGERYADLGDSKLGLFRDIESLRVTCGSGTQSGSSR